MSEVDECGCSDGDKLDHTPSRLELKVLKLHGEPMEGAASGTPVCPHQRFLGRCQGVRLAREQGSRDTKVGTCRYLCLAATRASQVEGEWKMQGRYGALCAAPALIRALRSR